MMEMWLKRSTLVFLTVAVAAMGVSGQAPVILNETQHRVSVSFGSSLIFHCCLGTQTNGHTDRSRVRWYFNPNESSFNESHKFHEELFNKSERTSTNDTEQTLLKYTLPYARKEHSGWYFCKVTVEIPKLTSSDSSGTYVAITKSVEHTTHPSLPIVTDKQDTVPPPGDFSLLDRWLWITLGVSAVILIVLLAVCALMRRRWRRSRADDPVYANTRPVAKQPSPRPGMPVDNLKMVSSSQNLRNQSPGRRYDEDKRRYKE